MIRNGLSGKNDVLKSLCETYVVTIRNMQLRELLGNKLPEHLKSGGIPPFFRVRP